MIFKATCPVCGIFTRIADAAEPCVCCNCKAAYVIEPDTDYNTPEDLEAWQQSQSSSSSTPS